MSDERNLAAIQARDTACAAVTSYLAGDLDQTQQFVLELLSDSLLAGLSMLALIDTTCAMTTVLAEELALDTEQLWSQALRQQARAEAANDAAE